MNLWISYILKAGIAKPLTQSLALTTTLKGWNMVLIHGFRGFRSGSFGPMHLGWTSRQVVFAALAILHFLKDGVLENGSIGRGQSKVCPSGTIPPLTYSFHVLMPDLWPFLNGAIMLELSIKKSIHSFDLELWCGLFTSLQIKKQGAWDGSEPGYTLSSALHDLPLPAICWLPVTNYCNSRSSGSISYPTHN